MIAAELGIWMACCDSYAVTPQPGGVYTHLNPTPSTFLKVLNDGTDFVEVASLGTSVLISSRPVRTRCDEERLMGYICRPKLKVARRTRLLAVLLFILVLTGPAFAEAECAWALWVNPTFAPTGWRLASGWVSLEKTREASATIRQQLDLAAPLEPGLTHDEHVKWAVLEGMSDLMMTFFGNARW